MKYLSLFIGNRVILDKKTYLSLIKTIFSSISSGKKIYVYLNARSSKHARMANNIIERVCNGLPYEIKRRFKYGTFTPDPDSEKEMNLVIVDKHGERPENVKDCYIFDFVNKTVIGLDVFPKEHPYFDFVWKNRRRPEIIRNFFDFFDSKTQSFDEKKLFDIKTYDDLYILFQMYNKDTRVYVKMREESFNRLMAYSNYSLGLREIWVKDIFNVILGKEKEDALGKYQYLTTPVIANFFIDQYASFEKEQRESINVLIVRLVQRGFNISGKEYPLDLVKRIVNNNAMLGDFLIACYEDYNIFQSTIGIYLNERINNIQNIKEVFDELSFWSQKESWAKYIFGYEPYINRINRKILEAISNSKDIITDTNRGISYLKSLQKIFENSVRYSLYNRFAERLIYSINENLFRLLNIDEITEQQLSNIDFSISSTNEKHTILLKLKMVLRGPQAKAFDEMKEAKNSLDNYSYKKLSGLIEKFFLDGVRESNFLRITCAFITKEGYDYQRMINYVFVNGGRNKVYDFIKWSYSAKIFYNKDNMTIWNSYINSITKYFKSIDKYAFIKNKTKQYLYKGCNDDLTSFLKNIEKNLTNNIDELAKLFREKLKHNEHEFYHIVCPYCFKKSMPEEVVFRAAYSMGDDESSKIMKEDAVLNDYRRKLGLEAIYEIEEVIDPDTLGEKFRRNVDGVLAEITDKYGSGTQRRLCPHCHNELFSAAGKMQTSIISTIGLSYSGITTFISVLLNTLMTTVANNFDAACIPVDNYNNEMIKQFYTEPLLKGGRLPDHTQPEKPANPIILQFRFKDERKSPFLLYLYDFAGENIMNQKYIETYAANVKNSDGLLILLAPQQLTELAKKIQNIDRESNKDLYNFTGEPRDIIISLYESFINIQDNQKTNIPTSIILTESDVLKNIQDDELASEKKAFEDYSHIGYFNIDEYKDINFSVGNLIEKYDSVFKDSVDVYFNNVAYFAVSALGSSPEYPLIKKTINPIRIDEPLLWQLYQLKHIEGRHNR